MVVNNIFNDQANYERKPLEEMHALAEEEEEINDEGVDDKDHPIAGAIGLRDQLIGGKAWNEEKEIILEDVTVELDKDSCDEDLDTLLDEDLDVINIGTLLGVRVRV